MRKRDKVLQCSGSMSKRLPSIFICVGILAMQGCANRYFYFPDNVVYQTPDQHRLSYEDVRFKSRDGTELHGWFLPAVGSNVVGTIIHFHGNAQKMTAHFSFVSWLPQEGFNLFVFDCRGYGRVAGRARATGHLRGLCRRPCNISERARILIRNDYVSSVKVLAA